MRIKLAILFTILILSAQYARQLSYMGCKLFVPKNATCDCQAILLVNEHSNEYAPTQHQHIHIDEFVAQNAYPIFNENSFNCKREKYLQIITSIANCFCPSIFKPPSLSLI